MQPKLSIRDRTMTLLISVGAIGVTGILLLTGHGFPTYELFFRQEWLKLLFVLVTAGMSGILYWKFYKSMIGGLMGALNYIAALVFSATMLGQSQIPRAFGILIIMLQIGIHGFTMVAADHFSTDTGAT